MEVLVIVDVQKAFPTPPEFVARIRRYARRFERRVITRFVNPPGSLFRTELKQTCCAPGTPDVELLIPPNRERGDIVVSKRRYGLPPATLKRLRRLGVTHATVCGMDTDACVLGVMFSLFDAGIVCRVKKDLCRSTTGLHREGMKVIEMQFPRPKEPRPEPKRKRRVSAR